MNGGLGEVISQPPLHFDGVGVFPSSNSIKIKIMAGTTVTRQRVAPTQTTQPERTGKFVESLSLENFKKLFGITKLQIKANPVVGKAPLMYADELNIVGAVSLAWTSDIPLSECKYSRLEDGEEDVWILCLPGSGGINAWDTLAEG